jgi:hypothetical protein
MGREPRSNKGYDVVTALTDEFKVKGTAGYPVVFVTDGGHRYTVLDVQTEGRETQVLLLEEDK